MLICLFDTSFEGFLTAFFTCYQKKAVPDLIEGFDGEYQTGFDCEILEITTDSQKAARIESGFLRRMGDESFSGFLRVFRSGAEDRLLVLFRYLLLVFRFGKQTEEMLGDARVIRYNEILLAVDYEIQRMRGFIRFRDTLRVRIGDSELEGGVLYAPFAPDNTIIEYITEYFSRRNAGMPFIIHDTKRNLFGLYNGADWQIVSSAQSVEITLSGDEKAVSEMWKQYFQTVSIASRKNKRQQDNYLPRRYRKFLNEFDYKGEG